MIRIELYESLAQIDDRVLSLGIQQANRLGIECVHVSSQNHELKGIALLPSSANQVGRGDVRVAEIESLELGKTCEQVVIDLFDGVVTQIE